MAKPLCAMSTTVQSAAVGAFHVSGSAISRTDRWGGDRPRGRIPWKGRWKKRSFVVTNAVDVDVDSTVNVAVDSIKAGGEVIKQGIDLVNSAIDLLNKGYQTAAPVVKDVAETYGPSVNQGLDFLFKSSEPAVNTVKPAVKAGAGELGRILTEQGVDITSIQSGVGTLAKGTSDAIAASKPVATSVFEFLTTTDPIILLELAAALAVAYILAPPLLSAAARAVVGYAGDVSAAGAVDALSTGDGDAYMIDVRTQAEKENYGSPDLPRSASGRLIEVEYLYTTNRRLRGQLRNPTLVECQITAMQIAALKKLSRDKDLYILDQRGSLAKDIARELGRRGFGNCYVINGGFGGWISSKLNVRLAKSVYRAEIIPPVIGTIMGTTRPETPRTRRVLPP